MWRFRMFQPLSRMFCLWELAMRAQLLPATEYIMILRKYGLTAELFGSEAISACSCPAHSHRSAWESTRPKSLSAFFGHGSECPEYWSCCGTAVFQGKSLIAKTRTKLRSGQDGCN